MTERRLHFKALSMIFHQNNVLFHSVKAMQTSLSSLGIGGNHLSEWLTGPSSHTSNIPRWESVQLKGQPVKCNKDCVSNVRPTELTEL